MKLAYFSYLIELNKYLIYFSIRYIILVSFGRVFMLAASYPLCIYWLRAHCSSTQHPQHHHRLEFIVLYVCTPPIPPTSLIAG